MITIPKVKSSPSSVLTRLASASSADILPMEEGLLSTKLQLPSPHLSVSQIEMYIRCPQQYKRRYVDGIVAPPGVALVEGSSHHEALAFNNNGKVKTGNDSTTKDVADMFVSSFDKRKKDVEDWEGEKPDDIVSRGVVLVGEYMKSFAPRLTPEAVEFEVTKKIGPVTVLGYVDVLGRMKKLVGSNSAKTVVDYKTVSRKKSEDELKSSLQLSFYGMAVSDSGSKKTDVGYCNLMKKTGKVEWQTVELTLARMLWFRRVTLMVADAISRGSFPPTDPSNWCCSERFCGYYSKCRGSCGVGA